MHGFLTAKDLESEEELVEAFRTSEEY